MFPGPINPKKMKQMMKQLGMKVEPIEDVTEIIIRTPKGLYRFTQAEVTAMTMQGVTTYQIAGDAVFEPAEVVIPDDDVRLVSSQAGVDEASARAALRETGGDIAEAIMKLSRAV